MGIYHCICLRYCLVCIGVCMWGYMGSEVNPQVVFQVSLFFFFNKTRALIQHGACQFGLIDWSDSPQGSTFLCFHSAGITVVCATMTRVLPLPPKKNMVVGIELRCSRLHDTLPVELSPNHVTVSACDLYSLVLPRPLGYQNSTLIGNPIPSDLP